MKKIRIFDLKFYLITKLAERISKPILICQKITNDKVSVLNKHQQCYLIATKVDKIIIKLLR